MFSWCQQDEHEREEWSESALGNDAQKAGKLLPEDEART